VPPGSVPRDFFWRELGIYAKDMANNEILYMYNNAGATADFITAAGSDLKSIAVPIRFGNAASVTVDIDQSVAYALSKHTHMGEDIVGGILDFGTF